MPTKKKIKKKTYRVLRTRLKIIAMKGRERTAARPFPLAAGRELKPNAWWSPVSVNKFAANYRNFTFRFFFESGFLCVDCVLSAMNWELGFCTGKLNEKLSFNSCISMDFFGLNNFSVAPSLPSTFFLTGCGLIYLCVMFRWLQVELLVEKISQKIFFSKGSFLIKAYLPYRWRVWFCKYSLCCHSPSFLNLCFSSMVVSSGVQ